MKIKTVYMDIEEVLAQPVQQHVYPKRPKYIFQNAAAGGIRAGSESNKF